MLTLAVTIRKVCTDRDEAVTFTDKVRKKFEDEPEVAVSALMTDTLEEQS